MGLQMSAGTVSARRCECSISKRYRFADCKADKISVAAAAAAAAAFQEAVYSGYRRRRKGPAKSLFSDKQ